MILPVLEAEGSSVGVVLGLERREKVAVSRGHFWRERERNL